jgi:6-pyruvoyl-tetrahydropterin synthase
MQIELVLLVEEGHDGMAVNSAHQPMEFGAVKRLFRAYIDGNYDHHLLLNKDDPWAQPIYQAAEISTYMSEFEMVSGEGPQSVLKAKLTNDQKFLPGLVLVDGDPTVENLAKWIAAWASEAYRCDVICRIDETKTNGAEVMFHWNSFGAKMVNGAT